MVGETDMSFQANIELIKSHKKKPWVRAPISLEFQVPMYAASGLQVRNLKVFERSNYTTSKWVRYVTRAGSYQVRI